MSLQLIYRYLSTPTHPLNLSSAVTASRQPSWTHHSSLTRMDKMALLCCWNTWACFMYSYTMCSYLHAHPLDCLIPLCLLNVQCNSCHAIFDFRNVFWMNGHTSTSSNKAWLINTMEVEVREMWFIFARKRLRRAHKNTVLRDFFLRPLIWLSPQKPMAQKVYSPF